MRTVYRIIDATGTEWFKGRRSAVLEKLARQHMRVMWHRLRVEVCRYEPQHEDCPAWHPAGSAEAFMAAQQ